MQNPKRTYHFTAPGTMTRAEDLDQNSLPQTEGLVLCVEDSLDWLALTRGMFGEEPPACLANQAEWTDRAARFLEALLDEVDDDQELARCRKSADDPWYDGLDELLDNFPDNETKFDADAGGDFEALRSAVCRLTTFWLTNVRTRLVNIQAVISGDGEVLATLKRHKDCGIFEV